MKDQNLNSKKDEIEIMFEVKIKIMKSLLALTQKCLEIYRIMKNRD